MNTPKKRKKRPPAKTARNKRTKVAQPQQEQQTAAVKPPPAKLDYAAPLFRLYAYFLDLGMLYVLIIVTKRIFGDNLWHPSAAVPDITIILVYFVVPTAVFGRTFGKWVLRIKVVDAYGHPPGVLAIPREIFGRVAAIAVAGIGLLAILFNKKRQGWHDRIAMTYVVYVRKTPSKKKN